MPNHIATLLGRAAHLQPALRPHRRLRGRRLDRPPLVRRRLHDRPQRRRRRGRPAGPKPPSEELRLLFVGRAEERKGLPVLLAAFEALVEHVPARLTVVGADPEEVIAPDRRPGRARPHRSPRQGLRRAALGRARRGRRPGRPVAGGRELRHGPDRGDGLRHPAGRLRRSPATATSSPTASTACWCPPPTRRPWPRSCSALWHEPERRAAMGEAGRESAKRYAWPRVADEVTEVYERAAAADPAPADELKAAARRAGLLRLDGGPRRPAKRIPSSGPAAGAAAAAAAAWPAASAWASRASSASASLPGGPPDRRRQGRRERRSAATSPGCWSPSL